MTTPERSHTLRTVAMLVIVFIIGIAIGAAAAGGGKTQGTVTTTTLITTTVESTLRASQILVNYSGSGEANSAPFAAPSAEVQVSINISATAALTYVTFAWYIYEVGAGGYTCTGSINNQQGHFVDYCYSLTAGTSYYVSVLAANCNWQVIIPSVL